MAKRGEVQLGDEVKDEITGLTGVVIAITDWLNGCERITIQPREVKDGKPVDSSTFDIEQVIVIRMADESVESIRAEYASTLKQSAGGPHDAPTRQPDIK